MDHESLVRANQSQQAAEHDTYTPRRYLQMTAHVPANARVLDVGCNTGRGGAIVADRRPDIELYGVEMLPERVQRIPQGAYVKVFTGTLGDLDNRGSFDALLMGELVEHIPYTDLEEFLLSAARLLVDNGRLILTTPNPHYILLRLRSNGTVLGGAHVSVHCPQALRQLLSHLGFEVQGICGTGRVSRLIGTRGPLALYGSYLISARRRP